MKLDVLDTLSIAGSLEKPNEDAFGHGPDCAWVLDGATGLADTPLLPGRSDAAWLAWFASRQIEKKVAERKQAVARRDLKQLTRSVIEDACAEFEILRVRDPVARYELPTAAMMMARAGEGGLECAFFRDCRLFLLTEDGAFHDVGGDPAWEAAAKRDNARLLGGENGGASLRSPGVLEHLRAQRERQNREGGYWILGLEPRAADFISLQSIELTGPAVGLLASDGFAALALDYGRYSPQELVRTARDTGLGALGAELRKIERDEDPDRVRFPRFKQSDDATALMFRVTPASP